MNAGWIWLAIVMLVNVAISLFYYVRVIEPMYLRSSPDKPLRKEPLGLRAGLLVLGLGTLLSSVLPLLWVVLATHASYFLAAIIPR